MYIYPTKLNRNQGILNTKRITKVEDYKRPIKNLVKQVSNEKIVSITQLALTASNRRYFRVDLKDKSSYIAVYNDSVKENEAFISYAKSLKEIRARVPKVHHLSDDKLWYIQDYLGDVTLFDFLTTHKSEKSFEQQRKKLYKHIVKDLINIQIEGYHTVDFNKGFPRPLFDEQSVTWDLNYFKYYFLKLSGITFDEQLLEDDFKILTKKILKTPDTYFLYRDFQSRNIMLQDNKLYYIDFQGGRMGPLQYDLASLLFDAKAELSQDFRLEMLDYYYENLPKAIQTHQPNFKYNFWTFALIRVMQAMGAYGYRGLFEKKQHFINSIPHALENLKIILDKLNIKDDIKYLLGVLEQLSEAPVLQKYLPNKSTNTLVIQINSFSYKKGGIPKDKSDNGGGFVFDCRAIHNPGRYEEYKTLTGKDKEVIDFFKTVPEMDTFLSHVYEMVDANVQKYIERDFTSLMVNFGCTGGQHRSVYSAGKLHEHLMQKFDVKIELHHIEQEKK